MKKFFTTDIPTKLLALGAAVFLWVYVAILLNPQMEITLKNIPITYSEHSTLTKNGYVITDGMVNTVNVKVRGVRSMLANLDKNNVSAYVDLSGCSETGTYPLSAQVKLPYSELSVISKEPHSINIVVDKVVEREFGLKIITDGEPKDKTIIEGITPSIETVSVKGPSAMINSIDSVVAHFDAAGLNDDVTETAKIILLNNNGEEIKSGFLTLGVTEVELECTVLFEKTVPVNIDNVIIPDGYEISTVTPKDIVITGKKDAIALVDSVNLLDYTFTGEEGKAEIALEIPETVTSKVSKIEIVLKETEENEPVNNEDSNQ